DFTIVDAALKTLLHIRFEGVELADAWRPRRVPGRLRIRQVFPDGLSITADSLGNVGDTEPLTGELSDHEPFLHIDHGRPPSGTVSSASLRDQTLQRGEFTTDVLGEYTTVSNIPPRLSPRMRNGQRAPAARGAPARGRGTPGMAKRCCPPRKSSRSSPK